MNIASNHFDLRAAPMRIGTVRLKVGDIRTVTAFYAEVIGLSALATSAQHVTLGAGAVPLLELHGDPSLRPRDRREAGLFHVAFLLPTRADLGRWIRHVSTAGVSLQGASDHLVSEAVYLADPEGNGIEVYADRPPMRWRDANGAIRMATDPLDLQEVMRAGGDDPWTGFPAAGLIGHVHLQVGDTAVADHFYEDVLRFDVETRYPGASFYGSGGYHHQLAANVWNSRGAELRSEGTAGLDRVEIVVRDAAAVEAVRARATSAGVDIATEDGRLLVRDPWGIVVSLSVAEDEWHPSV